MSRGVSENLDDEVNRDAILAEAQSVLLATTPATTDELQLWVLQVLGRYREFNEKDDRMKGAMVVDWMESFADFPSDVLERMRKAWRESPQAAFMPQEGQLLALRHEKDQMCRYHRQVAEKVLEALG